MAGNFYENGFLDFIAETLTKNGVSFFTFNNRGCEYIKDLYKMVDGKRTVITIGNAFEKLEDAILDISAAVDFVKGLGYLTVHLSGHSLGGPKVAYYVAKRGNDLASVIFISPADMAGLALKNKNRAAELKIARDMVSSGKGNELMPGVVWDDSYLSANTYLGLSDSDSELAVFNLHDENSESERSKILGEIKIPAYTIIGRQDSALVIPIENYLKKISVSLSASSHVETNILGDAGHGYTDFEQRLADSLLKWIDAQS